MMTIKELLAVGAKPKHVRLNERNRSFIFFRHDGNLYAFGVSLQRAAEAMDGSVRG